MTDDIFVEQLKIDLDEKMDESVKIADEIRKRADEELSELFSYTKSICDEYAGAVIKISDRSILILSFDDYCCTKFQILVKPIFITCDFDNPFKLKATIGDKEYSLLNFKKLLTEGNAVFVAKENKEIIDDVLIGLLHKGLTIEEIIKKF